MKFKTASLAVCSFLFLSLAAGAVSSAYVETNVPSHLATQSTASYPETYQLENFSLSLLLEFKSTGRCGIRADYSGSNPLLSYYLVSVPAPVPPTSVLVASADGTVYDYDSSAALENYKNGTVSITVMIMSGTLRNIGDPAYGGTTITVTNPATGLTGSVTFDNTDGWGTPMQKSTDVQFWGAGDLNKIVMKVSMYPDSQGRLTAGSSISILLQPFGETDAHAQALERMAKSGAWGERDTINVMITGRDSVSLIDFDGAYLMGSSWAQTGSFAASSFSPGHNSISASSAQSTNWDININLSSPSEGTLNIAASGWIVLPLTAEQKQMVSTAVAGYHLSPGMFNQQALEYVQNLLRYTFYGEVTGVNITQLDWDDAASKLTFSATATAEGTMFGGWLRMELPATITTTGSGSIPTTITSIEGFEALTLDLLFRIVAQTAMAELRMNLTGVNSTIGFEFEFELRTDNAGVVNRTENMVVVDFSALQGYLPPSTPVSDQPGLEKVSFTLKVPSNAQVVNLPSGYTQMNSTYTWTGSSALNAIMELLSGEAGTRISYYVGPASVTVENIQASVGQTVEVENYYIETVEIESEQAITVNFEEDQPVGRASVSLAPGVSSINIQAQRLPEKPPEATAPPAEKGIVSYYLEMTTNAPTQVENATVEFKVSQLWTRANKIDKASIRLLRYQDGQWVELKTTKVGEDENNVYLSAGTAGFSLFAVTGAQLPTIPTGGLVPLWVIAITAIVLVAVLIVAIWRYLSRGGKLPEKV